MSLLHAFIVGSHVKKTLERSWNSSRDDIWVHFCIVFDDFGRSTNCFPVKIENNQFFSIRFVFHGNIFGLDQFLNGECISVVFAGMCMQCICHALNISTFDGIWTNFVFKMRKYHYGIKTLKFEKNIINAAYCKLHKNWIYKIPFLTMHQAYNTIISCKCFRRGIHKHHLPENAVSIFFNKLWKFL